MHLFRFSYLYAFKSKSTTTWKTENCNILCWGSITNSFSAISLCEHPPLINAITPTFNLCICSPIFSTCSDPTHHSNFPPRWIMLTEDENCRCACAQLVEMLPSFQGFAFLPSKSAICIATPSSTGFTCNSPQSEEHHNKQSPVYKLKERQKKGKGSVFSCHV